MGKYVIQVMLLPKYLTIHAPIAIVYISMPASAKANDAPVIAAAKTKIH